MWNNDKTANNSATINHYEKLINFLRFIYFYFHCCLMLMKIFMFQCFLASLFLKSNKLKFQCQLPHQYNRKFSIEILIVNFIFFCALSTITMPSIKSTLFTDAFVLTDSDKSSSKQSFNNDGSNIHSTPTIFNDYNLDDIDDDYDFERKLSSTVVKIKYGLLQGLLVKMDKVFGNTIKSTKNHHHHHPIRLQPVKAYLGIPYASPPTGALRFMPPVTPTHWRGIRLATELQSLCPQRIPYADLVLNQTTSTEALKLMPLSRFEWLRRIIPRMSNQSEDCLYLNIYTPDLGSEWSEIKKSTVKKTSDSIVVADQRQVFNQGK